ncbi:MAG: ScpA family protein [Phycisphaerae bacterium]|nr:segregation/condensation protein A [Tepidisphaeraceae bacterium]
MGARPLQSIVSLSRNPANPCDYPASYPRLWVDKKTGAIRIAPVADDGSELDYRVELDVYNGPMDLLLYLIKRDELDIYDIPILHITDTYMGYVRMLRELSADGGLDINIAGDFLVMAATLMEIKSATLLPRPEKVEREGRSAADELADPRYELVQKLLEYKKFKDAATMLDYRQVEFASRFPRYPALRKDEGGDEAPPVDLEEVQVWDLLTAFNRLMKEVGNIRRSRFHEVNYDDTPIELHAADIEDRVVRDGRVTLRELIAGRTSRSEMVGIFLALLELIREKKVLVVQEDALGEVEIVNAPPEHRATYAHASMALSDEAAASTDGDVAAITAELGDGDAHPGY